MPSNPLWTVLAAAGLAVALLWIPEARPDHPPPPDMAARAQAWLDSLDPGLREKARLPFDDPARKDWHYIPRPRPGVSLGEMDASQRRAAHALLRSVLSHRGYLEATTVISLETVLRAMAERRGRRAPHRDPGLYWFVVFGDPGGEEPWGWKVEGHHLSLNVTLAGNEVLAFAPMFFGADPAEVREGPRAGLRTLAPEEDLARRLFRSLTPDQREAALMAEEAPSDILLGPGTPPAFDEPEGILHSALTEDQKALFEELLHAHAGNLRDDLEARALARITKAGEHRIRFAWAGGDAPGEPHYYRLHGPTFIVEYDNIQDGANHIHTVWRDPDNDFGGDALRRHHQRDHR